MNGIDFIVNDQMHGHMVHGQRTIPHHLVTPVRLIQKNGESFPEHIVPRVLEMLESGMTQVAVAKVFAVSTPVIRKIQRRAEND